MPTPDPEADMLHMQHAHVVALIVRQHEAALLQAKRDAVAKARAAAASAAVPEARPAAPLVHRPRPA
jgi:hypothetical protein